jgi:Mor family transcriptional regulator
MSPAADLPDFALSPPAPDLGQHAEALSDEPERWLESMREIASYAADELAVARPALEGAEARRLGARIAVRLCRELGGARYYWPKSDTMERAARDLAIYAEHDGTVDGPRGIRALARRYAMTQANIWNIIKRERAHWRAKTQPQLDL